MVITVADFIRMRTTYRFWQRFEALTPELQRERDQAITRAAVALSRVKARYPQLGLTLR